MDNFNRPCVGILVAELGGIVAWPQQTLFHRIERRLENFLQDSRRCWFQSAIGNTVSPAAKPQENQTGPVGPLFIKTTVISIQPLWA